MLHQVAVANAEAHVEADRVHIMKLISDGPGCDEFDRLVSRRLQDWMAGTASNYALAYLDAITVGRLGSDVDPAPAPVSAPVPAPAPMPVPVPGGAVSPAPGGSCAAPGQRDAAASWRRLSPGATAASAALLARRGLVDVDVSGVLDPPTVIMSVVRVVELLYSAEKLHDALALALRAKEVADRCGTLETKVGARLLGDIGDIENRLGHYSRALATKQEAMAVFVAMGQLQSRDAGYVLATIGGLQDRLGDTTRAQASLTEARAIYSALGELATAAGATLKAKVGLMHYRQGRFGKALAAFESAVAIRRSTTTMSTPAGAELAEQVGDAMAAQGEGTRALERYTEAREIRRHLAILDGPSGATLLEKIERSERTEAARREPKRDPHTANAGGGPPKGNEACMDEPCGGRPTPAPAPAPARGAIAHADDDGDAAAGTHPAWQPAMVVICASVTMV